LQNLIPSLDKGAARGTSWAQDRNRRAEEKRKEITLETNILSGKRLLIERRLNFQKAKESILMKVIGHQEGTKLKLTNKQKKHLIDINDKMNKFGIKTKISSEEIGKAGSVTRKQFDKLNKSQRKYKKELDNLTESTFEQIKFNETLRKIQEKKELDEMQLGIVKMERENALSEVEKLFGKDLAKKIKESGFQHAETKSATSVADLQKKKALTIEEIKNAEAAALLYTNDRRNHKWTLQSKKKELKNINENLKKEKDIQKFLKTKIGLDGKEIRIKERLIKAGNLEMKMRLLRVQFEGIEESKRAEIMKVGIAKWVTLMGTTTTRGGIGHDQFNVVRDLARSEKTAKDMTKGFASGGIVTRPMRGLIGEAGPEAVIPLAQAAKPGSSANKMVQKMATNYAPRGGNSSNSGGKTTDQQIIIEMDGSKVGEGILRRAIEHV